MKKIKLTKDAIEGLLDNLLKRSPNNYGQYTEAVDAIVSHVKKDGDAAVFNYTKQFDGAEINAGNIRVTPEEIEAAYNEVSEDVLEVIRKAIVNIRTYHEKQKQYSWFDSQPNGTILGQKVTPLTRVGVYVPGGKAAYPSSVSDEYSSGKGCRRGRDCGGDTAWKRRKSKSGNTCRCP